jgi:hypothetical protein
MPREKSADEVFCRSCGESIKEEAEICPECGVRNAESGGSSDSSTPRRSTTHDPSNYTTTVTDTWWQGVAGATGIWVLTVLLSSVSGSGAGADVAGLLGILAWALLPLSLYFDSEYVRANAHWNPSRWVYVGTAILLPMFCIVTGAVYLYRRHEVVGVP